MIVGYLSPSIYNTSIISKSYGMYAFKKNKLY